MHRCITIFLCIWYYELPLKLASHIQPIQSAAVRLALEGGFLDTVAAAKGKTITASEVAKETGYDELLIGEICSRPLSLP